MEVYWYKSIQFIFGWEPEIQDMVVDRFQINCKTGYHCIAVDFHEDIPDRCPLCHYDEWPIDGIKDIHILWEQKEYTHLL